MARVIEDNLGVIKSRPYPDLIFDDEDAPNTDSVTSDEFLIGNVQTALEIVVAAGSVAVVVSDSQKLTATYLYGDDFDQSIVIGEVVGAGTEGTIFAPDEELFRFVPPTDVPSPAKLRITTDASTAGKLRAWPELISR